MGDFPSRLDLYALGRDYLLQRATKIDPTQVDVQGSDANLFVGSVSVVAATIVNQLAYSFNKLLLDGATGDDLDRYAFDRYGLLRKGASAALGLVRVYRASNAAGAGSVPISTLLQTPTGIEYITTSSAVFAAADLEAFATVRAVQAGKATQVGANTITKFAQPSTLFDPSLRVINDPEYPPGYNVANIAQGVGTAGGEDAEDDPTFRARVRNFWNTARRGILAAIEFGATTIPGVVSAKAIEALTSAPTPARVVNLYVSDSSGVASQALATQVQVGLDDYRAAGIAVLVFTSIPYIVTVELALSFQANVDTVNLTEQIRAAIVNFINDLPVNGTLQASALYGVLNQFATLGLIVNQGTIVAPVGDLVPPIGQTIRTTVQNVTIL